MSYEVVQAFILILMAEMGDKTQMLAMAFATKYSLRKVLLGVLIGSLLNHGLAALLGSYLSDIIPINLVRLLASIAFIGFGLWSLKEEEDEGEEGMKPAKYGPILSVAAAFFMGEMGDKTQLTVITLSSQSSFPMWILLGTVTGMIVTSAMGVFVGSKLGKNIPEVALKIASASIFIVFGLIGLVESAPSQLMTPSIIIIFLLVLSTILFTMINKLRRASLLGDTPYKKVASELYLNTRRIQEALSKVCEESKDCAQCHGGQCTVRSLNHYLMEAQRKEQFIAEEEWSILTCKGRACSSPNLKASLIETIDTCMECPSHQKNCVGNKARETLEALYFGKAIPYNGNRKQYYDQIKRIDPQFFIDVVKQ